MYKGKDKQEQEEFKSKNNFKYIFKTQLPKMN